jgi:putative ABC transport system ATP-binding protein
MSGPVVLCEGVSRVYGIPPLVVKALDDVDLRVMRGEFVSLAGPSGSGKSTLLNVIGGLDRATGGNVIVEGVNLTDLDTGALADLRRDRIGFVFQAYNLIPVLSARENVEFIMELQGIKSSERRRRALEALDSLGIAELANRRPGELSGGQQQRVAVARAIVTEPSLLLADEPSANLDSESTAGLLRLLQHINREHGVTIITATHDPAVIAFAARRISMRDGRIVADERATPA